MCAELDGIFITWQALQGLGILVASFLMVAMFIENKNAATPNEARPTPDPGRDGSPPP